MRKALVMFGVVVAVALLASPVYAVSLLPGTTQLAKISDFSSIYDSNGNPVGLPGGSEVAPGVWVPTSSSSLAIGNTQATIFNVTDIYPAGKSSNQDEFGSSSSTQLTGVLANLKIVQVVPEAGGTSFVVDFAPVIPTASLKNPNYGGLLNVYESSTKNFTADPNHVGNLNSQLPTAPGGSVNTNFAGTGPNSLTAAYTFPTVTSGTLFLDAELVNLQTLAALGVTNTETIFGAIPFGTGAVLRETIESSTGTGSGFAYAEVMNGNGDYTSTVGSLDSQIDPNGIGSDEVGGNPALDGVADIALEFDLDAPIFGVTNGEWEGNALGSYVGPGYWPEQSEDPVTFGTLGTIPEPATLSLLAFGLVGILARRRK